MSRGKAREALFVDTAPPRGPRASPGVGVAVDRAMKHPIVVNPAVFKRARLRVDDVPLERAIERHRAAGYLDALSDVTALFTALGTDDARGVARQIDSIVAQRRAALAREEG